MIKAWLLFGGAFKRRLSLNIPNGQKESGEVFGCELMDMCPYCNSGDMPESLKEDFCLGDFQWCGRYMIYIAVERERSLRFGNYTTMEAENG